MVIFRFAERPQRQAARSTALRVGADAEEQFLLPFGTRGPVHVFAMVGQRFMHERNLTEDDLAGVVVQSRAMRCPTSGPPAGRP